MAAANTANARTMPATMMAVSAGMAIRLSFAMARSASLRYQRDRYLALIGIK
jgi:hypothetical protein